ncbi:DUF759 family protein, partial [Borreliella bissettiae]|uniref:DUF759 family protein n=1 Tax=Borrelia bissettiae TaxID=64897 RepID=UPI001E516829
RERVEKYRLTQTKKLMKQGMGFEKARKEAFRRSLMSDRDKRRLEYKELAKESKAKSKMLAASQGKGLVAKIAIGSALGNVIGNAVSKVGGGVFGFVTGFIKKSVEAISKKEKAQKLNTAFYTTRQRKILMGDEKENIKGIFHGKKGFERKLEQEEFLRHFTLVKGTLTEMDKLNETNLINTGNFMAELVSSGQASMQEAAAVIDDYLRGNGDMLYKIMVGTKIGRKYKQAAKDNFQKSAMHKDFGFRLTELQKVAADFQSFKLTEFAGDKEKIDSNLIKLEQSLMDVTAAGMQPVLNGASKIIDWVQSLIDTYQKDGFTGVIGSMVSTIVDPMIQPFRDLWAMIENSWLAKQIAKLASWFR